VLCAPEQKWLSDMNTSKKPEECAVGLTIAAVEDSPRPSPLDQDMSAVDPSPISLDLTLPGKPDIRHAAESGAARGRIKGRSLRREKRPTAAPLDFALGGDCSPTRS
jgi:hypothetical protein